MVELREKYALIEISTVTFLTGLLSPATRRHRSDHRYSHAYVRDGKHVSDVTESERHTQNILQMTTIQIYPDTNGH
jgi:hypothetical protein